MLSLLYPSPGLVVHGLKSLPSPHTTPLPSLVALMPALLWSYLPTFLIEEFIHFFTLRHFMRVHNSMCLIIKGRPVLEGTKDDDCCSTLENYCKVPHHVAHRNCMFKWYTMGNTGFVSRLALQNLNLRLTNASLLRPVPTCPICRGEIIFKVIQKEFLEKEKAIQGRWGNKNNWLWKLDSLIKDWRNVMNWRWIAVRAEIMVIYILIVWKFLKWREKLTRNLTYYNRT
ncbi:1351_t:CDS:2 [Funneliformis mosseae]|uniref:1351_t:CDS:1 n=1 Tax=Funneliformis mosseae TaxID=27381 RepID=A0A9N9FDM1_FUNMO|nr:1351_t:CDS:2 [Funneliformis mosseae]